MTPTTDDAALPGPVRQIGYVVHDLDQAVAGWLALGIGPFYVMRGLSQQAIYRGAPCSCTMSVAFSNTGELQIELIQQEDSTPSIYREFLDAGREGFHQLAWWTTELDATVQRAEAAGYPVVWSDAGDGGTRYAYVEPKAGPAAILEIMETNPATDGLATMVRYAAAGWDGSDPVRSLG